MLPDYQVCQRIFTHPFAMSAQPPKMTPLTMAFCLTVAAICVSAAFLSVHPAVWKIAALSVFGVALLLGVIAALRHQQQKSWWALRGPIAFGVGLGLVFLLLWAVT